MAKTKEISRRIKSVANTKKITRAMEMVAAAKMRKALEAVLKTRTYANLSWETVLHLANLSQAQSEPIHELLSARKEISRVAIIVITSNRGLCGGFNSSLVSKVKESIVRHPIPTDFILVGRKASALYGLANTEVAAEFPKEDILSKIAEIAPITKMAINDYLSGKYDKVLVAYTDFVSASRQVSRVKQILPVELEEGEYLGIASSDPRIGVTKEMLAEKENKHLAADQGHYEFIFEPSPKEVLDKIIPKLLEVQLFQAFLESNASEHSARMSAMHQATEAASDMVAELTLFYNKARQAGITAEIAEISAGANALAE
ncbi:MAG: ATP synthase F1 subunit gamma [Candidatus Falkowbacteria bacterium]|nr:ATP synthase F1 subunit gamma [Candidatus Falkowbacteria bacterium]